MLISCCDDFGLYASNSSTLLRWRVKLVYDDWRRQNVAAIYHPGLGRVVNYQVEFVEDDPDVQVAQVVEIMCRYTEADTNEPAVVRQAAQALELGNGDSLAGVWELVRRQMRFVRDEQLAAPLQPFYKDQFVETFIRPVDIAAMCDDPQLPCRRLGDCDDFVMYAAALLHTLGVPCKFVTIAADARDPQQYTHVYLAAYQPDGSRVPFDASHGDYVGWEHQGAYRLKEWPIGTERIVRKWALIGAIVAGGWVAYRKGWLN